MYPALESSGEIDYIAMSKDMNLHMESLKVKVSQQKQQHNLQLLKD